MGAKVLNIMIIRNGLLCRIAFVICVLAVLVGARGSFGCTPVHAKVPYKVYIEDCRARNGRFFVDLQSLRSEAWTV